MQDTLENRKQFAILMGKMGLAFRTDCSKEQMSVYWEFLKDRSFYQVGRAIEEIIKTGDRFPPVSKVRELAGSFREMKTREVTEAPQIEEFSSADQKPETAEDFFKIVGDLVSEKGV